MPAELPPVEAAPLMCAGLTTFNALRNSGARPGDIVAVLGLGGLGHLGVQYAAKMGFHTVGISRGKDKEPLARKLGALLVPPFLAERHGYQEGAEPSDELLEDFALHFSLTVYHPTSTCRIGDVVDPRLRVMGVGRLRVADASVMPSVIGGNTNASCIMIGEKAAEMIAAEYGVHLVEFVGERL